VPGHVGLMAGLWGFASNGVVHLGAWLTTVGPPAKYTGHPNCGVVQGKT